jgi:hypothetical protein
VDGSMWEQNLIPYSSQSIFFNRAEILQKWSKIQIMFLFGVFFGNCSVVDVDVQTGTQPCPGELYMGGCCQLVTYTASMASLSFSKPKTCFIHKLDLKNAEFKDTQSNLLL